MSGLDGSHARAQGEMKDYFGDEKEVDVHINGGGEFALFLKKNPLCSKHSGLQEKWEKEKSGITHAVKTRNAGWSRSGRPSMTGSVCVAGQEQWPLEEKGSRTFWMEQGTGWALVLEAGPRWRCPASGRRLAAQTGYLRPKAAAPMEEAG